jgi:hypothetical protein
MCFPWAIGKPDDLRSSRRRANALCLLQALPQNLVVNKAPGILHRLDQSAFVVTWRWPGLLVLDFRIVQLGDLAVAQRRQQLRCQSEAAGIRRAEGMSRDPANAGAVAFKRAGDPNVGEFSDAVVLKKFGDVPEDLSAL